MKSTGNKLRVFAGVLIIIIALALIFQYIHFNGMLRASKENNITEYNQDLKDRLTSELHHNKEYIKFVSSFIETVEYTKEDAEDYLGTLVKEENLMRSIYFVDNRDGSFITSDDSVGEFQVDLRDRHWYTNSLGEEDVIVSPVYVDALDGSLIITLSKSIYTEDNKLRGVLAGDVKVEDITQVVQSLTNEILDYSFLIDGQGNIIDHKGHECPDCLNKEALEDLSEKSYQDFRRAKSGFELTEIDNISGFIFYDLMEDVNWIVASFISEKNYTNTEAGIWGMFFTTLLLSMIIFATFTYSFKKYFINPTIQFYNDTKKIDLTGNQGYRMPRYKEDPFDEIRELANSIIDNTENLMIEAETNFEEITAQNEELEASYNQLTAFEQELRYQYEKNRAVNEALPDALFIISSKGEFMDIQVSSEKDLYILEEDYVGKYMKDVFTDEILVNTEALMENVLKDDIVENFEYELDGYAGIQRYEIRIAKLNEDQVLAIARNITKEKELEDELTNLSYKDQLTDLYNRRYFEKKIKTIDKSHNLPISIIMADINGLKLINDSFGHELGDQLIQNIGQTILKGCRSEDIVFRVSGDEFMVILSNTDKKIAEKVVKRIKDISKNTGLIHEELKDLDFAVSFGIGTKENLNRDIDDAVKEAEENMYDHKLYEGQKMRLKTVESMIDSLHKINPKLKEHTINAMEYGEKLGLALKLSPGVREVIKDTIFYQEVGKITLSKELINKTKAFTPKELEEINKHPAVGYRILTTVNDLIEVAKYVLYHHERYDGSGYPKGLKGEEIPFISRFISVVNFYVSTLLDKEYEDIMSKEFVIEKLREKSGTELDPKLVDIFIKEVLQLE